MEMSAIENGSQLGSWYILPVTMIIKRAKYNKNLI